jgi:quercetin dioxygenase-like cupin family protein
VQHWNLHEIEAPDGMRDPAVLHSNSEGRAVLIRLDAGQELGDHQVHERSWLLVVDGVVQVSAGGESVEAAPGTLLTFAPSERKAVASREGARVLYLLAPWPGEGHYRGGDSPRAAVEAR